MKKRIFGMLLMGAMVVASMSMFTSCKDYDDDNQKNSDAIAALQTQLSTLQSALSQAQTDLNNAKSTFATKDELAKQADAAAAAAAEAKAAAEEAAKTGSDAGAAASAAAAEAKAAAEAAAAAAAADAEAIKALQDQVAAAATVEALNKAVEDLNKAIEAAAAGKLTAEDLAEALKPISASIDAINEDLNSLKADVAAIKQWSESVPGMVAAVTADLDAQKKLLAQLQEELNKKADKGDYSGLDEAAVKKLLESYVTTADMKAAIAEALKKYMTADEVNTLLGNYVTSANLTKILQDYYTAKKVDELIANLQKELGKVETSVATATTEAEVKEIANKAAEKVAKEVDAKIVTLNVFVKRNLTSINLSPAKFYGGIEGIDIAAFTPDEEKMNDVYHYFVRGNSITLSEMGTADYHISPKTVDLSNGTVSFFTRSSDIIVPATTEKTRSGNSGLSNTNRVKPVYTSTDDLLKGEYYNAKTGILTVPFRVDNATAIANELAKGKGTIAAIQISQKDTTVTSDYALVVPTLTKQLLICDTKFASKNTGDVWNDIPGLENGEVNNYHLHRNFSYLALANTTATHEIQYDGSFNISEVLLTHAVSNEVAVKVAKYAKDYKTIVDTAKISQPERATAKRYNGDKNYDSDASLLKKYCSDVDVKSLKLYYDVHRVGYSLGSTKTEESNHIEILQNEKGEFIAYPRNIKPEDGTTVFGKTANATAVGRMPIVCIELKYQKGDKPAASDPTVTFAYMKFLIVKGSEPEPESQTAPFSVSDVWADCGDAAGQVKWHEIEGYVYDQLLGGIDKKTFDERYVFDFYKQVTAKDEADETKVKDRRYGYRFKLSGKNYVHDKDSIGQVMEEWNESTQGKEDATTHIIKWTFTTADYIKVYKDLKARGKLAYDWDKGEMTNTEEIVTYVRYAYKKGDYRRGNMDVKNGDPAIYIKLTIPVGAFHWALGRLGGTKTLTYWYELNSKTNTPDAKNAKEVRVNVPVPVPDSRHTTTVLSNYLCPWGQALKVENDNLLENTEFLKDLHDYFRNGELSAAVINKSKFPKLSKAKITPEFKFTLPSKSLGNATFDAKNGTWTVTGISGATYTLKLFENDSQIRISPYTEGDILCSLTKDDNDVQSVIKYHEGVKQDDILNFMGHNDLGERQTFTAYIMIETPDACAPLEFDDMWFNVRFLRPCDLNDPIGDKLPDAPNDWQYVDLAKYARVYDWRDYACDPQNRIGGDDITVAGYRVDYKYYQISLNTDELLFLTDAGLGTSERDPEYSNAANMININTNTTFKGKLWKTSEVKGLMVEKAAYNQGPRVDNSVQTTWIRYKNNSGVTGGFHLYMPIQMSYVFGNYPQTTQLKYVGFIVTKSESQVQK